MKEAYLQEKIREIDYKLRQQMEVAEQLNQEIQRLQTELKQHKHLIKQLKAFDTFKEDLRLELSQQNREIIRKSIEKTEQDLQKEITGTLMTTLAKHNQQQQKDLTPEISHIHKQVTEIQQKTAYSQHLLELLLDRLITERIIAQEQADILTKRAHIRAQKDLHK
ncbi:MAG: hypothetical protein KKC68_06125 [Candidatus Thermoplasmatota archaeon]|nr:hypothetical protein [Candidatus Thermoplasmatota archaeon]MBU1941334.1 hypothetical protein [Candidatus Thermoplasmatota archaeon]